MSQTANLWEVIDEKIKRNHQRAYFLLGNDLLKIFEYIEPVQANEACYGHQVYQLFLRVCTEFESVCKLACRRLKLDLKTNKSGENIEWKIHDYAKLNKYPGCSLVDECSTSSKTSTLSDYKFYFHDWVMNGGPICPLMSFNDGQDPSPSFYKKYNTVKHDREEAFKHANVGVLIQAFAGLIAALDWQGINVDPHIVADCSGETVIGARFGYFTKSHDSDLRSRINF
jgi:hypothetical protein